MLKRIVKVDDFRAMKSWAPTIEFTTVNLIYGANGSGKSTLSALFQEFQGDPVGTGGVKLEVEGADGTVSAIEALDDYFWPNVRVFNRSFVRRNIQFDEATGADATSLMTLGERQIEAEARREQIQIRLDQITSEQGPHRSAVTTNTTSLNNLVTRTATGISSELQTADPRFNPRSYNAPKVKALLADRSALQDGKSEDIDADLATIRMQVLTPLTAYRADFPDLLALTTELAALLKQTPVSVALPELLANPAAASWAQTGLDLHETGETCLFCGSAYTPERRAALALHFDASLVALQTDIGNFRGRVVNAVSSATRGKESLPVAPLLMETLREEYTQTLAPYLASIESYIAYARELESAAEEKEQHLFSELELAGLPEIPVFDSALILQVFQRNQTLLDDLSSTKADAARRVECSRGLAIAGDIDTFEDLINTNQDAMDVLEAERAGLVAERTGLPTSELNPQPLADSFNSDLAYLIGRSDLAFKVKETRWEITRNGEPARHLSEGEQTAISLLYFLSSLQAHDIDSSRLTVFIDDPVSSLDSNVLVGASSHLWGRLVDSDLCKQLFVLTHNFDLFRMWSNQIDRRRKPFIRTRPARMFELRMKAVPMGSGVSQRVPLISDWPEDANIRKRIRSEYHYLFWRLAHTLQETRANPSIESDIDAAAILPNVARRVLEGFLAFKYPDLIDNFEGAVTRANESADSVTQQRIVRFLHQFSHNGEGDTGRAIPRPEAVTILTAVFDLMKVIDPAHLAAMCVALDVDESQVTTADVINA